MKSRCNSCGSSGFALFLPLQLLLSSPSSPCMIGTKKNVPDTVETIDKVEGNTVLGEASVADGNDGEQDEQSYAQANADESVESQLTEPSMDCAHAMPV